MKWELKIKKHTPQQKKKENFLKPPIAGTTKNIIAAVEMQLATDTWCIMHMPLRLFAFVCMEAHAFSGTF